MHTTTRRSGFTALSQEPTAQRSRTNEVYAQLKHDIGESAARRLCNDRLGEGGLHRGGTVDRVLLDALAAIWLAGFHQTGAHRRHL